jgi:hypothetical protein
MQPVESRPSMRYSNSEVPNPDREKLGARSASEKAVGVPRPVGALQQRRRREQDEELLSLSTVLQSLGHEPVRVTLCDDSVIHGTLEESDNDMKCAAASAPPHSRSHDSMPLSQYQAIGRGDRSRWPRHASGAGGLVHSWQLDSQCRDAVQRGRARVFSEQGVARPHRFPSRCTELPFLRFAQLKLADQGRRDFTKRIRKQAPVDPRTLPEKLVPLTSDRVYEAEEHGTAEI